MSRFIRLKVSGHEAYCLVGTPCPYYGTKKFGSVPVCTLYLDGLGKPSELRNEDDDPMKAVLRSDTCRAAEIDDPREEALLEAEKAIFARVSTYALHRDKHRAAIAATHMACLTVRRLRTGDTPTVYPDIEVVSADLIDAFKGATASLAAAISLLERGGKKAAPSDTMFEQMLTDYRNALARVRVAMVYREKT